MKKSLLVTLSSAVVISGVMFFNNNTEDTTTNQSKIKKTETAKVFSERKKKMKGLMPFDKPDMFEKFHAQIRTKKGQSESDYELNYTFNEYEKAVRAVGLSKRNDNIVWKERGPGNVSGRTRGIIVDVSDKTNNTWYAGSAGGGIWKTVNAGVSWTEKTFKNLNLATTSLVQAKSNPYIMYAGTGEGFGGGGAIKGNGIFKSVDRGETWFQLESTAGNIDFGYVNRLIVDPSNDKIIIASTNTAIMKSYDGGNSWKKVYDAGDKVQQIIADPTSFSIQYATEKSAGVLKSVDAGETWTLSTSGIETKKRIEIGISPSNPKILYASVEAGSESHLYRTSDAAASWTRINYTNTTDPKWLKSQGWYDNTVAVNPFDENIVYLGGVDTWRADVSSDITSENRIKDVLKENTDAIFKFVNWGGPAAGGGLGKGSDFYNAGWYKDVVDVQPEDFVSVELRFGNGLTQKAYRFERNSTSGQYEYKDYIEVPFQVWDIVNNKQLSLSFRDWAKNGEFDLIPEDKSNLTREYLSVNAVEYSESADANLAKDDGMLYKNIYSMWLSAATESSWNPSSFPSAKLTVDYGKVESGKAYFTRLTDWWRDVKHPQYTHADHHNFTIVVTGDTTFRFIDGNDGGVAYSDDKGANWIQPTNGFNSTQFYGADKHPTKDEYVGGTQDNGSFKSTIGEDATHKTAYAEVLGGDGFVGVWNHENPDMVLAALYNNRFYRTVNNSNDDGEWKSATIGMTDANNDAKSAFITSVDKTKRDGYFLVSSGGSGVWRSDDFGGTWTLAEMEPGYYFNTFRTPITISNADQRVVWVGAANNYVQLSTDGAVTFKKVPGYKGLGNYFTSGLATHPTDPNTAFMLFSQSGVPKIVKTTDMGQTWTDISGFEGNNGVSSKGFPNVAVYDLLIMPYNTDIYWACTEIGIFVSEDAGDSWKYMNNPAFPAVSIWEAGIVGDQVILATHGRGIWTATIPELAGYSVANSTKVPKLKSSVAIPNALTVEMNLRSVYDSTVVKVNGKTAVKILGNTVGDTTVTVPVTTTGLVSVYVASYDGDKEYRTPASKTNAYVLKPAVDGYVNDFNDASGANDFTGHFAIETANGFDNAAIHSEHNYSNSMDHIFMLLSPVKISAENAVLEYKDVAIVEPGDPNTSYGDSKFWDYVIVEGSKDGVNWFALVDGYDADLHTEWRTAYDNKSAGDKSMFKTHSINLLDNDNISVGDQVFIRFRLYADNYTNGWGWAIDDLKIQAANIVGVDNATSIPETYELDQNYPNPFNPSTKIRFALPEASKVKLTIYNTLGQEVEVLVNEEMDAGYHTVDWNASRYASGAYFYTLSSKDFVKTKKLMFIK